MQDLTIVIPAYNEAEALGHFLPQVLAFCREHGCRLIVVNDGSRDGTAALLTQLTDNPLALALHHKLNRGYGGAIKSGLRAAKTRYVITIDADGQHRLEDVAALFRAIGGHDADMVVGRRHADKESRYRKFGKGIIRRIARMLMPLPIHDLNSGMKIYRTELVQRYLPLCPDNMAFSDIITLVFVSQRHLVLEEPITVHPRKEGTSTVNTKTAFDTVMEILHIVVLFNPMRIFLPLALFFLSFSVVWGLPFLLRGEGVSVGTLFLFVTGLIFFFLGLIAEQLSLIRRHLVTDGAEPEHK